MLYLHFISALQLPKRHILAFLNHLQNLYFVGMSYLFAKLKKYFEFRLSFSVLFFVFFLFFLQCYQQKKHKLINIIYSNSSYCNLISNFLTIQTHFLFVKITNYNSAVTILCLFSVTIHQNGRYKFSNIYSFSKRKFISFFVISSH